MCRQAAGDILVISATALALPLASHFVSKQVRQDGRVVVDDRVRDQPGALVADLNLDVGPPGQLLLSADLGDSRAISGPVNSVGPAAQQGTGEWLVRGHEFELRTDAQNSSGSRRRRWPQVE